MSCGLCPIGLCPVVYVLLVYVLWSMSYGLCPNCLCPVVYVLLVCVLWSMSYWSMSYWSMSCGLCPMVYVLWPMSHKPLGWWVTLVLRLIIQLHWNGMCLVSFPSYGCSIHAKTTHKRVGKSGINESSKSEHPYHFIDQHLTMLYFELQVFNVIISWQLYRPEVCNISL